MRMRTEFRLRTLHEEPMAEYVAVEFWSGSGRSLKCLQTLPLQFLKSLDG